jgi:Restriction Endonuclease associating with ARP
MTNYTERLMAHLQDYKNNTLGIADNGEWRGKQYGHILPPAMQFNNLLEHIREDFQLYLRSHPEISLHKGFHHLNSSQAFAFNLFYPYFVAGGATARHLSKIMGVDKGVAEWAFETIPDTIEGTNVDVCWTAADGTTTYCEVKLSETEFGKTKNDARHRHKLEAIYRPRLIGMVKPEILEEDTFFKHYQLLRNISLLHENEHDHLVLFFPRENSTLAPQVERVMNAVLPEIERRITIAYWEVCIEQLIQESQKSRVLAEHASQLRNKYLIQ